MKIGTKVAVCQDGKWSRRVPGVVVRTKHGNRIEVRFQYPSDSDEVTAWFRRAPPVHGVWKRKAYFAGWADLDCFCPWFTVYKWRDSE